MSAMIFYVFQWAAIFLSDRLDAVTNFVQGRGGRRMAEMPEWNGLLWRFLFILGQIPYFVYWALNFDTTQVFTSFLGPLILIAIVHFVFAGVGSFLCYWFGPPREGTDASLLVRSSIDGGGKAPLNGARSAYQ